MNALTKEFYDQYADAQRWLDEHETLLTEHAGWGLELAVDVLDSLAQLRLLKDYGPSIALFIHRVHKYQQLAGDGDFVVGEKVWDYHTGKFLGTFLRRRIVQGLADHWVFHYDYLDGEGIERTNWTSIMNEKRATFR